MVVILLYSAIPQLVVAAVVVEVEVRGRAPEALVVEEMVRLLQMVRVALSVKETKVVEELDTTELEEAVAAPVQQVPMGKVQMAVMVEMAFRMQLPVPLLTMQEEVVVARRISQVLLV
jgi:hypothetical protein